MNAVATLDTRTEGSGETTRRRGRAPIDLVHLARQTFGSVELEREVLSLFVAQTRPLVARIAAAEGVERAALVHRLKGSARGVGATRVAEICEAFEAKDPSATDTLALVSALVGAEEAVRAFVEDLF